MQLANQLTLRVNFVLVFWLRRKKLLTFFPKLFQLPTHIFIYIYNLFIYRLLNFDTSVCTLCVSVCACVACAFNASVCALEYLIFKWIACTTRRIVFDEMFIGKVLIIYERIL